MHKCISIIVLLVFLSIEGVYADSNMRDLYNENPDDLWVLFMEDPDSETGTEILVTLGRFGKGNQNIIDNINDYLAQTNYSFVSGESVNYSTVSACIAAIVELGDVSSYPVLFNLICADYPEVIVYEAYGALDLIDGNLKQFLSGIIEKNPPEEKFIAFKTGMYSQRLSVSERGQLAELALELAIATGEENADLTAMRYAAIAVFSSLRWTRANTLAIRHYYRVQADYLQGIVPKSRLIEAIECLGAVGNSDAALALGLQLGLINARAENTGVFDADITLAIVKALGRIGDNAAFDLLLDASNLSYGENITSAAREAINRLKW